MEARLGWNADWRPGASATWDLLIDPDQLWSGDLARQNSAVRRRVGDSDAFSLVTIAAGLQTGPLLGDSINPPAHSGVLMMLMDAIKSLPPSH